MHLTLIVFSDIETGIAKHHYVSVFLILGVPAGLIQKDMKKIDARIREIESMYEKRDVENKL